MKCFTLILLFSSCIVSSKVLHKSSENNIMGWWERYYPENTIAKENRNLTHIEFMKNQECRYTVGSYEGEKYLMNTINNAKWKADSLNPTEILIYPPALIGPEMNLSVLSVSKSELVFLLHYPGFQDTVYMKKLPPLH